MPISVHVNTFATKELNTLFMDLNHYPITTGDTFKTWEFKSVGPKGIIPKIIFFQETDNPLVVNLAFGDKNKSDLLLNDKSVSNNGDREKILNTVASSVIAFTKIYPDVWVYARGSSPSRTRLYQIGINKRLEAVQMHFDVYGEKNNKWHVFEKNTEYNSFFVKRKIIDTNFVIPKQ